MSTRVQITRLTPFVLLILVAIFLVSCAKQRDTTKDGRAISLPSEPTTMRDHVPPARTPVN